jgi:hypothetical protein
MQETIHIKNNNKNNIYLSKKKKKETECIKLTILIHSPHKRCVYSATVLEHASSPGK